MTFGRRIRDVRIKADLGLKEAAKLLGRGLNTLIRLEADKKVSDRTKERAENFLKQLETKNKK